MVDNPRSTKRKAIIDEEDMVNTDNVLGSCKLNGVACDFREKNIFQQKKYVISITLVIEVSLEIQVHMLALEVKQCSRGYCLFRMVWLMQAWVLLWIFTMLLQH